MTQSPIVTEIEIRCINRSDRTTPDDRIHHVGGVNSDGSRWKLTEDQAIAGIKDDRWKFWAASGATKAQIVVAKSKVGREYLKLDVDELQPDSLLSLPECP
jgi:hypothetical protein